MLKFSSQLVRTFYDVICISIPRLKNAEAKHREKSVEARCRQHAINDLNKYYIALNWAIMRFHQVFKLFVILRNYILLEAMETFTSDFGSVKMIKAS